MAISRMQEPRQLYGLGSLVRKITRPIKKAVKGVSKIAKSPIGKMALLAAAGYGLGAVGPGGFSKARMLSRLGLGSLTPGTTLPGTTTGPSFFSTLNPFGKNFSMKNLGITAGAAGFLLPFVAPKLLAPKEEDVEAIDYTVQPEGIAAIVNQAKDYYRTGGGGNLDFMARKEYVLPNFYAAEGGIADLRPGYRVGGASGREYDQQGSNTTPRGGGADASKDDFSPPPTGGGGDDNRNQIPSLLKNAYGIVSPFIDPRSGVGKAKTILDLILFKKGNVDDQDLILETGDQTLPGSNLRTEVTDIDLKRAKEPMTQMMDYDTYKSVNPSSKITPYEFEELKKGNITQTGTFTAADGGRARLNEGGDLLALGEGFKSERLNKMAMDMFGKTLRELNADEMEMLRDEFNIMKGVTEAKEGGLMNLNGLEMDFRANGGFVPIGAREKADDVPARLSKNEFVMTADAVRGAGGGSIERGAQKMYNTMKELESRVV